MNRWNTLLASFKRRRPRIFAVVAVSIAAVLAATNMMPVQAAVAHVGTTVGENGAGSTQLSISNASNNSSQLLIAVVSTRGGSGVTITPPSGWVLINTITSGTTLRSETFYRVQSSTGEPNSYSFGLSTSSKTTAVMGAYSGVDLTNPIDVHARQTNTATTTATAPSVTTTVANTMLVAMYGKAQAATFTVGSGMNLRNQVTSSGGGSAGTKIASALQDIVQPATGATGTKTITASTATGVSIGHLVALRPAPPATLGQQTFRWFNNVNAMNFSSVQSNPTTGSDAIYAATNDTMYLYTTGYMSSNGNDWRIEKRNLTDGTLVGGFGTGGAIDINVSSGDDRAWGIDQDTDNLYVVGQDASISGTNTQWRIEKRDKTTGALVSGFGTSGVMQSNPTTGIDTPKEVKVDDSHVYIAGFDDTGAGAWRIEKRDKATGALVSGFGTNGAVVTDYEPTENDEIAAMVIDANNIYVGGFDYGSGTTLNSQSRIEKRDKTTGALITGFGTGGAVIENPFLGNSNSTVEDAVVHKGLLIHGSSLYTAASQGVTFDTDFQWRITKRDLTTGALDTNFGTNGVVNVNPSSAIDNPTSIRTDGDALFIGGFDRVQDGGQSRWRVERRDLATGAELSFGFSGGVYTSNISTGHDELRDLVVTGNNIYGAGYDLSTGNYQMHIQKVSRVSSLFSSEDSSPRAAQGAPATTVSLNEKIRLRLLLKASTATLTTGEKQLKLQFATQSGTCDSGFVGESYSDVTTTSAIAFWDNSAITDGTPLTLNISDPTDGGSPITFHMYVEGNNFTSTTDIASGSNGMWDISLYNRSSADNVTYCFRVVESSGTVLSNYAAFPSLTTGSVSAVTQSNYRWLQNADSTTPGAGLAGQNTATSVATGTPFRLRQLLSQTSGTTPASTAYKLQSGEKVSTCSAATYSDVAAPMGFFNNAAPVDDATISSTANDPTPVSGSVTYQTYNENGAFTNPTQITSGNNGLWDFSLTAQPGAAGKTYCFRVVTSAGAQLSSYAQYPEISFTASGPTLDQQMRGGASVLNGTKTPITF